MAGKTDYVAGARGITLGIHVNGKTTWPCSWLWAALFEIQLTKPRSGGGWREGDATTWYPCMEIVYFSIFTYNIQEALSKVSHIPLEWTAWGRAECWIVVAVIVAGIPMPHAGCHVMQILSRMAKLGLHCFSIPIKVGCCTYTQETVCPSFPQDILYLRLCKITMMELTLPSIAFQWSSCFGRYGENSARTTQAGFVCTAERQESRVK